MPWLWTLGVSSQASWEGCGIQQEWCLEPHEQPLCQSHFLWALMIYTDHEHWPLKRTPSIAKFRTKQQNTCCATATYINSRKGGSSEFSFPVFILYKYGPNCSISFKAERPLSPENALKPPCFENSRSPSEKPKPQTIIHVSGWLLYKNKRFGDVMFALFLWRRWSGTYSHSVYKLSSFSTNIVLLRAWKCFRLPKAVYVWLSLPPSLSKSRQDTYPTKETHACYPSQPHNQFHFSHFPKCSITRWHSIWKAPNLCIQRQKYEEQWHWWPLQHQQGTQESRGVQSKASDFIGPEYKLIRTGFSTAQTSGRFECLDTKLIKHF